MKTSILFAGMIALFLACGNQKKADNLLTDVVEATPHADMHTAENSLDYYGVYKGTLPAADCPGIETTVTLNPDSTCTLHSVYIDQKDGVFDETGTYLVEDSILTMKRADGTTSYYHVEEGQIRMLNADKQPVTGSLAAYYILKKE